MNLLMSTPLWGHGNASNFLDLGVVWWAYAIQIPSNLGAQISYANELFQDVLWHNISIPGFLKHHLWLNVSKYMKNETSKH